MLLLKMGKIKTTLFLDFLNKWIIYMNDDEDEDIVHHYLIQEMMMILNTKLSNGMKKINFKTKK